MFQKQENIVTGTREMMDAALADALELVRLGKWPEPPEGNDHLDYDEDDNDDIIVGTAEMKAAAGAEMLAMIREGRWPEPYEGDDQLDLDDDDLPPMPVAPLKAAE